MRIDRILLNYIHGSVGPDRAFESLDHVGLLTVKLKVLLQRNWVASLIMEVSILDKVYNSLELINLIIIANDETQQMIKSHRRFVLSCNFDIQNLSP